VLKKSLARAEYATIKSRRVAIRISVAPTAGFLTQNCAATPLKIFFQHYRPEAAIRYWITSSAVANSVSGMARRSALALVRLITNSNLVDCTTGSSAGLAPLLRRDVLSLFGQTDRSDDGCGDRCGGACLRGGSPMFDKMRREFITLLAGAAASWPLAVRAQQASMPVIGFLGTGSPFLGSGSFMSRIPGFNQGLSETGFAEGRNVAIEYRWADNHNELLPALAADLVRRQVSVIVTNGPGAVAAKAATARIPIIFNLAIDPVEVGLVGSLSRPGGNLTGVTSLGAEVGPKRLELLHEMVPTATSIGILSEPTNPLPEALSKDLQAAADTLGLQLYVLNASTVRDFDSVFATLRQRRLGGLVITPAALFGGRTEQLARSTVDHAVPAISVSRGFAAAGGLMSYGAGRAAATEAGRVVGTYTGRILKGEKPSDLPVQQSTKVELIINLKTAKALGLNVPELLLVRADEIIE
jgi:putative ABC transport system substrate-binding protein